MEDLEVNGRDVEVTGQRLGNQWTILEVNKSVFDHTQILEPAQIDLL